MPEAPDGFVNSWLRGPFAPVDQEVTVYGLEVTGAIPRELEDGHLLRVGPNPVDPQNPVTYNWFTGNGGWNHVSYQVIDTKGTVRVAVDVPVSGRPVVHDCALTQRYAVFLDGPVAYSDELLQAGSDFPFLWDFEYPTRWVLIPRDGVPGDPISAGRLHADQA